MFLVLMNKKKKAKKCYGFKVLKSCFRVSNKCLSCLVCFGFYREFDTPAFKESASYEGDAAEIKSVCSQTSAVWMQIRPG